MGSATGDGGPETGADTDWGPAFRGGVSGRGASGTAPCFPSLGPPSPVPGLIGPASANTRARLSRAGGVRCA